jgi:hypothetical protein
MLAGETGDGVVVEAFVRFAYSVKHDTKELAREVHRAAVGQVAAVRQVHTENGVAGRELREVDGHVGLRSGMRLHVDVLGTEQLLGAIDGKLLGDVDELAAAVVAASGITLGILVGENRALRFENGAADDVLGSDQLEVVLLPLRLLAQHASNLRIGPLQLRHARASLVQARNWAPATPHCLWLSM